MDGNHPLVNMRVLVVEENTVSRQFLHEQILALKMRNANAATAHEALDFLRKAAQEGDPYPLAIIDLEMPKPGAMTLARQIKTDGEIAATRLLLLAGFGKRISSEEWQAAGFLDCCFKPTRQSTLFDCLANALVEAASLNPADRTFNFPSPEATESAGADCGRQRR